MKLLRIYQNIRKENTYVITLKIFAYELTSSFFLVLNAQLHLETSHVKCSIRMWFHNSDCPLQNIYVIIYFFNKQNTDTINFFKPENLN